MKDTHVPGDPVFRAAGGRPNAGRGSDQLSRDRQTLMAVLARIGEIAPSNREEAVLSGVRDELEVDTVRLLVPGRDPSVLTAVRALGIPGSSVVPVPVGEGLSGWSAEHRRAAIIDDARRVRLVTPGLGDVRSAMVAPIVVEGELLGVLEVGSFASRRFDDGDLALLEAVAGTMALLLDREGSGNGSNGRVSNTLLEQLEAERSRLEAVLEQLPAGVLIAEAPSGRVVHGNRRIEEILRHPVFPSQAVEEYGDWKGFHPDGRAVEASEWPLGRAIRHGERIEGAEYLYLRGDGTRTWITINAAPIVDADGSIVGGVVVLLDVDAERRATEELRFLAQVSSALHSTLDYRKTLRKLARLAVPRFADWCAVDLVEPDGRLSRQESAHRDPDFQRRIERLVRKRSRSGVVPRPVSEVLRTGDPLLIPTVTDATLEEWAVDEEHLTLLRTLGLRSAIVVPIIGRDRMLGLITFTTAESSWEYSSQDLALAEEVARRSASAIENAELFEAASEANRAKSDFLAVMSHELRTPLAAIMGYTELLQIGIPVPLPEQALHQIERIDNAARHQLQLVEEILTFSRLSAGQETVSNTPVDVADLIREAAGFIRPAADRKDLALELTFGEPDLVLVTDPAKLRQILINLLFNAVQFTAEGRIDVRLSTDDDNVLIAVSDTGIGIETAHHRRIFDAFWQVRQSSTREVGGTGLGLTVAQRMAQILGGAILVQSEVDRGSTFTIRLPRRPDSDGPSANA
jgi:signal transduction histidine kinase